MFLLQTKNINIYAMIIKIWKRKARDKRLSGKYHILVIGPNFKMFGNDKNNRKIYVGMKSLDENCN